MEAEIHVSGGVGTVPADENTLGVGVCGYLFNVEVLSRVELDCGEKDQSSARGVVVDRLEDLLCAQNWAM